MDRRADTGVVSYVVCELARVVYSPQEYIIGIAKPWVTPLFHTLLFAASGQFRLLIHQPTSLQSAASYGSL